MTPLFFIKGDKMDYKKIGEYLQENIDYIYFNCVYTCTYGDGWIDSIAGTSKNFIMWKGIVIWETGILEVNPGAEGNEKEVTMKIFELLDTEFVHALGSNNFDEVKDYYKIKGIKFQSTEEEIIEIEEVEDLDDLEEVTDDDFGEIEPVPEDDDLRYIINLQIRNKNIEIEKRVGKYPESNTENYWMIGIDLNTLKEEELQSLSIFDRDFW